MGNVLLFNIVVFVTLLGLTDAGEVEYQVVLITSNENNAGTPDDVYITIVGTKGNIVKKELCDPDKDARERGETSSYKLQTTQNVGDITCVKFTIDGVVTDKWNIQQVKILYNNANNDQLLFVYNFIGEREEWLNDNETKELCIECTSEDDIYFQCPEKCIWLDKKCDLANDCETGYDERDCECTAKEKKFQCPKKCIWLNWKCDGDADCENGYDERDCPDSGADIGARDIGFVDVGGSADVNVPESDFNIKATDVGGDFNIDLKESKTDGGIGFGLGEKKGDPSSSSSDDDHADKKTKKKDSGFAFIMPIFVIEGKADGGGIGGVDVPDKDGDPSLGSGADIGYNIGADIGGIGLGYGKKNHGKKDGYSSSSSSSSDDEKTGLGINVIGVPDNDGDALFMGN